MCVCGVCVCVYERERERESERENEFLARRGDNAAFVQMKVTLFLLIFFSTVFIFFKRSKKAHLLLSCFSNNGYQAKNRRTRVLHNFGWSVIIRHFKSQN